MNTTRLVNSLRELSIEKQNQVWQELRNSTADVKEAQTGLALYLPLYVDKATDSVYFLDKDARGEDIARHIHFPIDLTDDEEYLNSLEKEALEAELVRERRIDPAKLVNYFKAAAGEDCQEMRVKRAAKLINLFQPKIDQCRDAGEMFLQQSVYSPIAELFCSMNPDLYCADKIVHCAHAVFCKNKENNVVQHRVSCMPDGTLGLSKSYYAAAMMELTAIGEDLSKDMFRCTLMTTMSLLSIREYGKLEKKDAAWLDSVAIPFVVGHHNSASLYAKQTNGTLNCQLAH
jgi:hypothetical protein